jgi:glycosyltransferase involved in cell wall biosynthesis
MQPAMRVLLINQYFPPDTAPTGVYLFDLARALAARGHDVTVVCSRRGYNSNDVYPEEDFIGDVRVRRVAASGYGRRRVAGKVADYASFSASLARALSTLARHADLIISLTTPPYVGLLAARAARRSGAALAHWIMDIYPDVLVAHGAIAPSGIAHKALAFLARRELGASQYIACLGDDMAERLRRYLSPSNANRVEAIPLWGDPALTPWPEGSLSPVRAEQNWRPNDLVLMYSGNMGRGHRLGEFLAAACQMRADKSVKWVFAGGGRRCEEVARAQVESPDAPIALLPYAPVERLREHLCAADVHLASLDSQWEGCMVPSKIQGIFAVGKPLIFVGGRNNAPARWIEEAGAGWVVPENNVPALLDAVESARDPNERVRRGRAARAFACARFDRDANLARLCDRFEAAARPAQAR